MSEHGTVLDNTPTSAETVESLSTGEQGPAGALTTRRGFLGGAGRKALYVTPGILTLTAQEAVASGFICGSALKHTVGSPCATDGSQKDCCPVDMDNNPLLCNTETMVCENY